ncbi:MAG: multicopper oxidase domain-containing protein [Caldilineaceae bacterium]
MDTNRNNHPSIPHLGMRLAGFLAIMAVILSSVLPVAAAPVRSLQTPIVTQTSTINYGTAGNVTFSVSVSRTQGSPNNFRLIVSGLPGGVSVVSPSSNTQINFSSNTQLVTLTIHVNAGVAAGSYNFNVQANGQGTDPTGIGTLTINAVQVAPTITFGAAPTPTYLGGNFTVNATTNSNGALTYSAVSGPCALVSGATFSTSGAGVCVVQATTAATTNYTAGSAQQSVTIAPATPTITFISDPYAVTSAGDFTVAATTNTDGARSYSWVSGPCTLADGNTGTFTPTGEGTCVVQIDTVATTNFTAGTLQQTITIIPPGANLYAVGGSTTLPGSANPVPVWGYTIDGSAVSQPGGPTLEVNQGDLVVITLHNNLPASENTSLLIQGQTMAPDLVGVAQGGSKNYVFTADHAGTYLYEAGLVANGEHQVAMGLYGVLIVRPATAGQAYANANTAYDDEAVLLLSELDPVLNANPTTFDLRNYHPKYWLINGKVHPATDLLPVTAAGSRVLLRYVNAGLQHHSMAVLGLNQTVIAQDGSPLAHAHQMVAETIAPGETADTITTIPATAAAESKFAVYDANPVASGAMLTFLYLSGTGSGGDTTGPTTGALMLNYNVTGDLILQAHVTDSESNVQAAEYYIDSTATTAIQMSASDGAFDSPAEDVVATIPVATLNALASGSHTILVRGQDDALPIGNWGAFALATIFVDHDGPAVSGLLLSPNPSNGTADVMISATADDSASGNSNVQAAEYTIDGGAAQGMAVNNAAPIVSLTASIAAGTIFNLTEGVHVIAVRSQDVLGNWGDPVTKNLLVDKTAPTTSNVIASPNPTNGSVGISPTQPVVRVTASFDDGFVGPAALNQTAPAADTTMANHLFLPFVTSGAGNEIAAAAVLPDTNYVKTAEGFFGTPGANGTGFPFAASDGLFDSLHEEGYVDIPLTTIALQCANGCTINVHSQDGAGNWESTYGSVDLIIDKVPPTVTSITLVGPTPTSATSVQFLVTFSESVVGVTSSNFTLISGGGLTGAAITDVTGSGTTWTVTASTGSGGGTLGLNLTAATGIRDVAGNDLPTTGLPFVGPVYTLLTPPLYFSTLGNSNPPSVGGNADDADIYLWNGAAFSRVIDASVAPYSLPSSGGGNANVDGFDRVDDTHFYMSFNGQVNVPGIGNVQDEDVVYYNAGTWTLFFDGSANGLGAGGGGGFDLDAISIVSGVLYFSTDNNNTPPGAGGGGDDADIYRWNGGSSYTRVINANGGGGSLGLPTGANVDGFVRVDDTHFYMSFNGTTTNLPGLGNVQDVDVVYYNNGTWSLYFDGSARGMAAGGNLDVDAFDLP